MNTATIMGSHLNPQQAKLFSTPSGARKRWICSQQEDLLQRVSTISNYTNYLVTLRVSASRGHHYTRNCGQARTDTNSSRNLRAYLTTTTSIRFFTG